MTCLIAVIATHMKRHSLVFSLVAAAPETYTLSLHDALPILSAPAGLRPTTASTLGARSAARPSASGRSEEHTSELQSLRHLVCRLLLEKKKTSNDNTSRLTPTGTAPMQALQ